MEFQLAGGAATYSATEALDAVQEYAFATVTVVPGLRFPGTFEPHEVPRYAYRTYDCVPASPGAGFSDLDLLVSAGLNARIDMPALARLRSFTDRAAAPLERAHRQQPDFLRLTPDDLIDDPATGTTGRYLLDAWRHGVATPGLGAARVYKTLHHKRPQLVPLLDNQTIRPVRQAADNDGCTVWQLIHDEVTAHAGAFADLAKGFEEVANGVGDVSLSWLRLYDILLWMKVARP